ncbi:MAG TPA: ABC transporter substrate-binding protein [Thermomicrobiales bacterium]|nr:ABC transporter substrate-binding protein [Thermomicrobiales bacterium]
MALVGAGSFVGFALRAPVDRTWARVAASGTLRVAVDPTYPPFESGARDQPVGLDADLARMLGRRLGVTVVFVPTSFDSLYDVLRTGGADATISALTVRPEERSQVRYSTSYLDAGARILVRADSPLAGLADLRGHTIGAELGSDGDLAARSLARREAGLRLDSSFDSGDAALAALLAGNVDAASFDGVAALTILNTHPELRALPSPDPAPLVVAMPQDAAVLQGKVDAALADLRASGALDDLARRWFQPAP